MALLRPYYRFAPGSQEMLRMVVDRAAFRPPAAPSSVVQHLTDTDLDDLHALYVPYQHSVFHPDQLKSGPCYGVHADGMLMAAGGTHTLAPAYGIGAVGNIYTRPEGRGRGYASAITAAVVADLLSGPCHEVILNVAGENTAAQHVYRRLGFRDHCLYWDIELTLERQPRIEPR